MRRGLFCGRRCDKISPCTECVHLVVARYFSRGTTLFGSRLDVFVIQTLSSFGVQLSLWIDTVLGIIRSIRPEHVIPKHGVLAVVALRNPVMNVVCLRVEDGHHAEQRKGKIKTGVVPPGKNAADTQKQEDGNNVQLETNTASVQKDCPQMVVFSEGELDRMHVDRIVGGTTGCLLVVVVFVDERIHRLDVKEPMQDGVEKVVDKVQGRKRQYYCFQREILGLERP
mmetsp:Transcript_25843/g.56886  ORF Transcript_25843/g.56886 Transcript_25843/m.56886 type:complete len:226 (+) Transcript_25843:1031-1708(+)